MVLVNELLGGLCLDWLGVAHPAPSLIDIPGDLIDLSPGARFSDGRMLEAGLSFGSQYWQSDPGGVVDPALLTNRRDVGGNAVFGTWVMQFDGRQYRTRASAAAGKYDYIPVDQGHSFGNPAWTPDSLRTHPMQTPDVPIALVRSDVAEFAGRLGHFGQDDAEFIVEQVPLDWLAAAHRAALVSYLTDRAARATQCVLNAYPIS